MSETLHVLLIGVEGGALAVRELLGRAGESIELIQAPQGMDAADARGLAGGIDCVVTGHCVAGAGGVDAREVLSSLRRVDHATPVVVLGEDGGAAAAVELMKGGACDYLVRGRTGGEALARAICEAVRDGRTRAGCETAARQSLAQTTRSRDEAVALLDTLVGGAPVGIAFFDPRLRYVRVNRELARINGLSVEAHLGKYLFDALPKMNPQVGEDLREVLRSGRPIVNTDVSGETPADPGVTHDWIVSYYPVRASGGSCWAWGRSSSTSPTASGTTASWRRRRSSPRPPTARRTASWRSSVTSCARR
jgi:PAS domain-containing protein